MILFCWEACFFHSCRSTTYVVLTMPIPVRRWTPSKEKSVSIIHWYLPLLYVYRSSCFLLDNSQNCWKFHQLWLGEIYLLTFNLVSENQHLSYLFCLKNTILAWRSVLRRNVLYSECILYSSAIYSSHLSQKLIIYGQEILILLVIFN